MQMKKSLLDNAPLFNLGLGKGSLQCEESSRSIGLNERRE